MAGHARPAADYAVKAAAAAHSDPSLAKASERAWQDQRLNKAVRPTQKILGMAGMKGETEGREMKPTKISQKRTTTSAKPNKPRTPDDYLAAVSKEKRTALEKLRKDIKAAAPEAEECISYQLPAFRLNKKFLVAYGAAANHCAFYPGSVVEALKKELKDCDTSKGTIRFPADKPLPAALVRKLVKLRMAKNRR
jgi:uncharacterized protein YdhG (YjbR/CyaY superfamily)